MTDGLTNQGVDTRTTRLKTEQYLSTWEGVLRLKKKKTRKCVTDRPTDGITKRDVKSCSTGLTKIKAKLRKKSDKIERTVIL